MRVFSPLALFALALLVTAPRALSAPVRVATDQHYHGWRDAIIVSNGVVEAVVVPSIGRVMQLRFAGEDAGPFWENSELAGRPMPATPWTVAHGSFGGDKTWPAPQSLWQWPPPASFDATAHTAHAGADGAVRLVSPIDPQLGLRAVRHLTLDPAEPVMRIATTYEKLSGEPVTVSVWVISQLRDPVAVFLPIPSPSRFATGATEAWPMPAAFLRREGDWLRFTRDPAQSHKTGNDGTTLVWAGERQLLRMSISRVLGADYPDGGCSVEVYGNKDPFPYVELETLSPVQTLRAGETLSATTTYRLARRTPAPLAADVRALLALPSR